MFDYVVIGGGAAGAVVAARLSENPRNSVLLLEAGAENTHEASRYVTGAHSLWEGDTNWGYVSAPQKELNGRTIMQPRGKMIGGSAALNIGSWARGTPENYRSWDLPGWDWETIKAVYKKIERSPRENTDLRGHNGPMHFENTSNDGVLTEAFRAAAIEVGVGETKDRNAENPLGFDVWETIFPEGRRWNTADGYLEPARRRENLKIETNAHATRLNFDGQRVISVSYEQGGHGQEARIGKEVVLCCGAINSPQLLLLSGVGPAGHLRDHGINVVENLPGVGENLGDHLRVDFGAFAPEGSAQTRYADPSNNEQLQQWRETGGGPLAFNDNPSGAFTRSSPEVPHPDIELMYSVNPPMALQGQDRNRPGWYMNVGLVQPKSRGHVRLASANAKDHPILDPRYLSDPADMETYVKGVQLALRHAGSEAMKPFTVTDTLTLSIDASVDEIKDHIRANAASIFHPACSVKMGRDGDTTAALDPQLRVRGVQGVRVADASSFPNLISGHTMAPSILMAEMVSSFISKTT